MHAVRCVTVFNAGHEENVLGTCLRTGFAILKQTLRCEATVVFRHHQDTTATLAELLAQSPKGPAPVV